MLRKKDWNSCPCSEYPRQSGQRRNRVSTARTITLPLGGSGFKPGEGKEKSLALTRRLHSEPSPELRLRPSQREGSGNGTVSLSDCLSLRDRNSLRVFASPRDTLGIQAARQQHRRSIQSSWPKLSILLVAFLATVPAFAQDVIELKNESGQLTKRTGLIVDWTGNQINLKTKTRTRKINALQVTNIQTNWPAELEEARQLMRSGKFAEASPKLIAARESEKRAWVQQIITAELAQCFDAIGKTEEAVIEVLRLYQDDPQTRFFHLVPLPWLLNAPYPPDGRMGKKMLQSKNSFLALISSSLLLTGAERENAIQRLQQLTSNPDPRIAQLATTQLWRNEFLTADKNTVERWKRQMDRLPDKLRAGPLIMLAEAQSRVGDTDAAVINFMKLPILYPEKKSLCALSLFRCSEILEDNGQAKLAGSLQQELLQNYPASQFAERARQK